MELLIFLNESRNLCEHFLTYNLTQLRKKWGCRENGLRDAVCGITSNHCCGRQCIDRPPETGGLKNVKVAYLLTFSSKFNHFLIII